MDDFPVYWDHNARVLHLEPSHPNVRRRRPLTSMVN